MNNKTRFQEWLIIVALIIWVGLTTVTCSGLWNAATEVKVAPFYIVVSIILLVATCVAAFFIGKRVWDHYGKLSIEETAKKK